MQTQSEYPILFSGPMVRAILDGRKTQTRRPVKPQPERLPDESGWKWNNEIWFSEASLTLSVFDHLIDDAPYGGPGDLMYVRENFHLEQRYDDIAPKDMLRIAEQDGRGILYQTAADNQRHEHSTVPRDDDDGWAPGKMRPSLHMPKVLSRLWLEVKDVRVERVQSIDCFDCIREGIFTEDNGASYRAPGIRLPFATPRHAFRALWDTIHDEGGLYFRHKPWVWVYTFQRIDPADTGA